jgi:hypothetical protein
MLSKHDDQPPSSTFSHVHQRTFCRTLASRSNYRNFNSMKNPGVKIFQIVLEAALYLLSYQIAPSFSKGDIRLLSKRAPSRCYLLKPGDLVALGQTSEGLASGDAVIKYSLRSFVLRPRFTSLPMSYTARSHSPFHFPDHKVTRAKLVERMPQGDTHRLVPTCICTATDERRDTLD